MSCGEMSGKGRAVPFTLIAPLAAGVNFDLDGGPRRRPPGPPPNRRQPSPTFLAEAVQAPLGGPQRLWKSLARRKGRRRPPPWAPWSVGGTPVEGGWGWRPPCHALLCLRLHGAPALRPLCPLRVGGVACSPFDDASCPRVAAAAPAARVGGGGRRWRAAVAGTAVAGASVAGAVAPTDTMVLQLCCTGLA